MIKVFANAGTYEPCGIFTKGHFILMTITIIGIIVALKHTVKKNKKEVYHIIKCLTIMMCIMEIARIIYNIQQNSFQAVNTYLPLYYCSILLYAGFMSAFGKGIIKKVGDVTLATGTMIGGIVFLIYPSTSLPIYPAFHILSIHSFLYHGAMIYIGILINKTRYINLKQGDIKYFASLIGVMCAIALPINKFCNGNLMFISNNFPGTPIEILYHITDGGAIFSLIMIVAQMTIPYYISYYAISKSKKLRGNQQYC